MANGVILDASPILKLTEHELTAKAMKAALGKYGFVRDDSLIDTAIQVADFLYDSFSYSHPVSGELVFNVHAQPAVTFQPWQDGQSVVMAEGQDGFNQRFQTITDEINGVAAELQATLGHLKALREEVATALAEVGNELNALHRRINKKKPSDPIVIGPVEPPVIYDPKVKFPDPIIDEPIWEKYRDLLGDDLINQLKNGGTIWRPTSDPDFGILHGLPVKRVDVSEFNGKKMEVWQSGSDLLLRPLAAGVQIDVKPVNVAPVVGEVGELGQLLDGMRDEVTNDIQANGGQVTMGTFLQKYGSRTLKGGRRVDEMLQGVDPTEPVTTLDNIYDASSNLAMKRVSDSGTAEAIIAGAVGLTQTEDVGNVSTEVAKFIEPEHRSQIFTAAGDLNALAGMNPDTLIQTLAGQGGAAPIDRAKASEYISAAKFMVGLGRAR